MVNKVFTERSAALFGCTDPLRVLLLNSVGTLLAARWHIWRTMSLALGAGTEVEGGGTKRPRHWGQPHRCNSAAQTLPTLLIRYCASPQTGLRCSVGTPHPRGPRGSWGPDRRCRLG